jgi:hypothetical protein
MKISTAKRKLNKFLWKIVFSQKFQNETKEPICTAAV